MPFYLYGVRRPGSGFSHLVRGAQGDEEQQLIAVLQSDSSLTKKDAACARLKRIGTDQSVPALAALLTDEQLSHSARYALESMPSAKAGEALADALAKTSGLTKVGIINSLGFRGETAGRACPGQAADGPGYTGSGRRSHGPGPDRHHESPQSLAGRASQLVRAGPRRCGGCLAAGRVSSPGSRQQVKGAGYFPGAI